MKRYLKALSSAAVMFASFSVCAGIVATAARSELVAHAALWTGLAGVLGCMSVAAAIHLWDILTSEG